MKKRFLTLALALTLILASTSGVFATTTIGTAGDTATADVELTAAAANFSVTVPMVLPVSVDANGAVTVGTVADITNNSAGPVEVKDVAITAVGAWTVVPFSTDMGEKPVGTEEFGFEINGDVTDATGLVFTQGNWPLIKSGSTNTMAITYDAVVPAQESVLTDVTIANVVFTVGWKR